jgi:hypothetical protein
MADVFLCQTGQLTAASRRELKRAGVVVVEVEDPSKCQFIRATETVSGDDMLTAALRAMSRNYENDGSSRIAQAVRSQFTLNLLAFVEARRSAGAS